MSLCVVPVYRRITDWAMTVTSIRCYRVVSHAMTTIMHIRLFSDYALVIIVIVAASYFPINCYSVGLVDSNFDHLKAAGPIYIWKKDNK